MWTLSGLEVLREPSHADVAGKVFVHYDGALMLPGSDAFPALSRAAVGGEAMPNLENAAASAACAANTASDKVLAGSAAQAKSCRAAAFSKAVKELDTAPIRISCEANTAGLLHCVVQPWFRPPGALYRSNKPAGNDGSEDEGDTPLDPAAAFGYELDPYQKVAGRALEASESVIVSAPTSSGKTTVAVLALQQSLAKRGGFAVFCAPIKALSNQMFSEFHARFPGKVGLLTGDHCISPRAPILVVTTEIFRCMLHTDRDFVMKLQVAIFDEVHYLSDSERGPAWEESMVLLPPGVPIVCLSATMANPIFLAGWLCQLKCRTVHAIQKRGRPVPLRHFVHGVGQDPKELVEVLDAQGNVYQQRIHKVAAGVRDWHKTFAVDLEKKKAQVEQKRRERIEKGIESAGDGRKKQASDKQLLGRERLHALANLVRSLLEDGTRPLLIFCFSKAACDVIAEFLLKSFALVGGEIATKRRLEITRLIKQELHWIPAEDLECKQKWWVTEQLLPKGLGVHHGGLVPTMRELTEMIFKRGLLDVLVCTETFGMGLNMPARAVVFSFRNGQPLTKFDGKQQRVLTPTEYLQMSGRAGRRKLDTSGTAIMSLFDPFEATDLEDMLRKQSPAVKSSYEMQASSALRLLRHSRFFLDWFGRQTLLQFESRGESGEINERHLNSLIRVMQHPQLNLVDGHAKPTALGRACAAVECGDVLLVSRLLLGEHLLEFVDELDLIAYLTSFVLERAARDDQEVQPLRPGIARLATVCEDHAQAVDSLICQEGLIRLADDSGGLCERLRSRKHLVEPFRNSWLEGASLDATLEVCGNILDAGGLVRLVRRLDEFGRQVATALKALGRQDLSNSIRHAISTSLRRGIPFCESLYFPRELRGTPESELQRFNVAEPDPGDVWALPEGVTAGKITLRDPRDIGFSQNSIAMQFTNGEFLRRKLHRLLRGEAKAEDVAKSTKITFHRGEAYTLGNRRLAVLRMYVWIVSEAEELLLPFQVASGEHAQEWGWETNFTTGCFRGTRTVIRGTGEVVGVTPHDSLCSLDAEPAHMEQMPKASNCNFWSQYGELPESVRQAESPEELARLEAAARAEEEQDAERQAEVSELDDRLCANGAAATKPAAVAFPEVVSVAGTATGLPQLRPAPQSAASARRPPPRVRAPALVKRDELLARAIAYCQQIEQADTALSKKRKAKPIKHGPEVIVLFGDLDGRLPPGSAARAAEIRQELEACRDGGF